MPSIEDENELTTQYDSLARDFYALEAADPSSGHHREKFYARLDFIAPGARLLDLGCGGGKDLVHYRGLGAVVHGVDSSPEMVSSARQRVPGADVLVSVLDRIPFPDQHFDVVLSKYAIQSVADVGAVFREIHRVLAPGGTLMYLAVHPFRQFFERRRPDADYFAPTIVESSFFQGKITVREPTHTLNDYLSVDFLSRFDIDDFLEGVEPSAEMVGALRYPGFMIVRARKRA
ncbi:MAG TPA: class I SAM-dependent methyltransferase [Haliangium sp.]|nr:class I SAM-dependent methyltransferase [Haliangium sp.]